ncbi:kelch repeat-containing protein [Streptomyces diastatochromogenes]|nr:kelch repeat-containing protein [Streptomyces diastatochromogenes]
MLVVGALHTGAGRAALAYCELYDPGSRTWTPAGSLAVPRTGHQATPRRRDRPGDRRRPGDTPVGARFSTACAASVEQYSPGTDSWAACPDLPVAGRGSHRAVALRTGRVLVFGGTGRRDPAASGLRGAVLYDPAARTWTATGGLATGRSETVAVELADGRVLTTGGLVRSGPATPDGTDDVTATTELTRPDPHAPPRRVHPR